MLDDDDDDGGNGEKRILLNGFASVRSKSSSVRVRLITSSSSSSRSSFSPLSLPSVYECGETAKRLFCPQSSHFPGRRCCSKFCGFFSTFPFLLSIIYRIDSVGCTWKQIKYDVINLLRRQGSYQRQRII